MLVLLMALASADPLPLPTPSPGPAREVGWRDGGLPVADGVRTVPRWVERETEERAASLATDLLALAPLSDPAYALRVEVEEAPESLGQLVGAALVGRLSDHGKRVDRAAPTMLVARVSSTGVVRTLEPRVLAVKERVGWPWALASVGASFLMIGGVSLLVSGGEDNVGGPTLLVLGGASAVGAGALAARPPQDMEVRCPVFDVMVHVALRWTPADGGPDGAIDSDGTARVRDDDAPCTGNMARLREQM